MSKPGKSAAFDMTWCNAIREARGRRLKDVMVDAYLLGWPPPYEFYMDETGVDYITWLLETETGHYVSSTVTVVRDGFKAGYVRSGPGITRYIVRTLRAATPGAALKYLMERECPVDNNTMYSQ